MVKKTKDYIVNYSDFTNDGYEINANKKNAIRIDGFNGENTEELDCFIQDGKLIISDGENSLKISNYKNIKYIKTDYVKSRKKEYYNLYNLISNSKINNFLNPINSLEKPYYNSKKLTVSGTNYNDFIDLSESGYEPKGKASKKHKGLTINGGYGHDSIIGTDYNDNIKGGNGNDTITGGIGNDTITGGKGTTVIKYSHGDDNDVVNITKGENLILDFTDCINITNLSDLKYTISGKNLIITVMEDEFSSGTITLKNYTKNKLSSLNFQLYNQELISFNNLSELTNEVVFSYNNSNFNKKKVLNATKYDDVINITNNSNKKYTLNAGNGENDITVSGGKNAINSGKNNDTFHIADKGSYTISAGAGSNTINIDNSDIFGTVIINEQKVNAINNIVLSSDLLNPVFEKADNDLKIIDDNGEIVIKSYYANVKNKSIFNISLNDELVDIKTFMAEKTIKISGSKKITGSDNDDIITVNGKKATKITAGKGNDLIEYSKANRTMYFTEGDGNDTIKAGKGIDTLKFAKGTEVKIDFTYDFSGNIQPVITYGTKGDTITFTNYTNLNKLFYYIGKKKYSVKSQIKQGEKIEITKFQTHYDGTAYNDTIIDSLDHYQTITINALDGNDYIDAHNDIVYAGAGNDFVSATNSTVYGEDGHDVIVSYGTNEIYGGKGNDTITNENLAVTYSIYGNENDDLIINNGEIQSFLDGGDGNDTIINNNKVNSIDGGDGNDIITNNSEANGISGGKGNDTIIMNSASSAAVFGSEDDDIIIINAPTRSIFFSNNDGNDTIYLNTPVSTINWGLDTGTKNYSWSGNDAIIKYNNDKDSITIKNYNPLNKDIVLKIEDTDFATLCAQKNITGTDENDYITNNFYQTTIYGANGDDTIINEENAYANCIYGGNDNDVIINYGYIEYIDGGAGNNDITNYSTNFIWDINCLSGDDTITNNGSLRSIFGGDGNNIITNNGTVYSDIQGGNNNNIIENNGKTEGNISCGLGTNTVTNNRNAEVSNIYCKDGNDIITNNGYVHYLIDSGKGNDNITSGENATVFRITGGDGNDTITNDGIVERPDDISATTVTLQGYGDNEVECYLNSESISYIYGGDGDDVIINNGTAAFIFGGTGNDNITNNGTAAIFGGSGDDTITTTENASISGIGIRFSKGDGNDILYLNAQYNKLYFDTYTGTKTYSWSGNDLIIKYNNNQDSVTIKNYDPDNHNIIIGTTPLSDILKNNPSSGTFAIPSSYSISQLSEQIAEFTCPDNNFDGYIQVDTNNSNELETLIAEYSGNN